VFRALLGSLLLFVAIVLPGFYAVSWLALMLGLDFSVKDWFTPLAAGIAAILGVYRFFWEKREKQKQEEPKIVLPGSMT
jgi:membrane protein DedA with SNARE-associated domain